MSKRLQKRVVNFIETTIYLMDYTSVCVYSLANRWPKVCREVSSAVLMSRTLLDHCCSQTSERLSLMPSASSLMNIKQFLSRIKQKKLVRICIQELRRAEEWALNHIRNRQDSRNLSSDADLNWVNRFCFSRQSIPYHKPHILALQLC